MNKLAYPAKYSFLILSIFILITNGCIQKDNQAPQITDIQTSSKILAKSDCIPTYARITANITDDSSVKAAALWYRIGQDQEFSSTPMQPEIGNRFVATLIALDIPGGEYGTLEFYILAEDEAGNQSKSQVDTSVQLLPCVAH